MSAPPPPDGPRYERLGHIASGGGGDVFLARDRVMEREVALKVLLPDRQGAPDAEARFFAEARLCGRLAHPNIVPVHDLGAGPAGPWFTMKPVRGRTFEQVLAERAGAAPDPAFLRAGLDLLSKVSDAVAFANAEGVVHCDLKPANVMQGDFGQVFVLDWGIARGHAGATGTVSGTPGYMAPEQALGGAVDARTDVHGIGAVLYELLTGGLPYPGPSARARFAATLRGAVVPPREARPDWRLPERLCAIAMKALAPDPADRYPTVLALQEELRAVLHGGGWFDHVAFPAGHRIVGQGEPATQAFIVVSGQVEVRVGDRVLRTVGPGEVFGELGFATGGVRTADVVALTPVTARVVSRESLDSVLGADTWLSVLVRALASRFQEAHEALHPR